MATTSADPAPNPDGADYSRDTATDTGDARPGSRLWRLGPRGMMPRLPLAVLAAIGSGLTLLAAFPPFDLWWLAPVGVALFGLACHRRRFRAGFGLGMLAGLAFFLPLLTWTSTQVGQVPWIALSVLEALYFGLLGAAVALCSRLADRRRMLWPLFTALLWTGQEALRDRTPFGGFPWGRLAFSQADSPVSSLAWLGGAPLVTFAVAAAGGFLLAAAWRDWRSIRGIAACTPAAIPAAGAVVVVAVGLAVPVGTTAPAGEATTVAVVQGSVPRLGLDFNSQRRAVLDNHVQGTLELAEAVERGGADKPALVVWPENASDIDPLANADAAKQIDKAAQAIGVPILVGTLSRDSAGNKNISLVWDPADGPGFQYVKQHPVPFAEYIPMKPVVRAVAGLIDSRMLEGIDRVNGFQPGDKPGVIPVGDTKVSGIICFEIAYDDLVRTSVTEGAGLLAVQTNNATFNDAEARQQLAMVQLRSIEHGRDGLMASTVGVSAFTDAYGGVHEATTFDTADVIVSTLNLGEGTTPATFLGSWPELLAAVAAIGVLLANVPRRRGAGKEAAGAT